MKQRGVMTSTSRMVDMPAGEGGQQPDERGVAAGNVSAACTPAYIERPGYRLTAVPAIADNCWLATPWL